MNATQSSTSSYGFRFGLVATAMLAATLVLAPAIPHEQRIALHLGEGSDEVSAVTARVGRDGDWDREVTWRFDRGAPRSVRWPLTHTNGAADLEVEIETADGIELEHHTVHLEGDEANVDLAGFLGRRVSRR